jgi:hypothetical protein
MPAFLLSREVYRNSPSPQDAAVARRWFSGRITVKQARSQ